MATNNSTNNLPWILIQTQTASSSANLSFTSLPTAYSTYMIVISAATPSSGSSVLGMQVNTGSGYIATGYQCGFTHSPYNSTTLTNNNSTTNVPLSGSVAVTATIGVNAVVYCYNFNNGNTNAYAGIISYNVAGSAITTNGWMGGTGPGTTTITALQFSFSAGNIATGKISLYGQQ